MKQNLRLGDYYALAKHKLQQVTVFQHTQPSSAALPSVPIRLCPAYTSLKRPASGILAKEERLYSDRKAHTERDGKGQGHVGAGQGPASELILYSDYPRIAQHLAGPNGGQSEYSSSTVVVRTELRSGPEEISKRKPGQRLDSRSAIVRNWFGSGQAVVWHLFDCASVFSRSVAEGLSKASRTLVEARSKDCRTSLEQQSNNGRKNIEESCVCTHAKVPARSGLGLALGFAALLLVGNVKYTAGQESFSVSGKVISIVSGIAIEGATVTNKRTGIHTVADRLGEYRIAAKPDDILTYSFIGYVTTGEEINGRQQIIVALDSAENILEEVDVVSTGYQTIPKERATGSFVFVDSALLNRAVSTDIISRLRGVAGGLLFDNTVGTSVGFSIRGRSTIFANTDPLIILDNFPYDGDINNINPNDIASVSILKDAAAASIWGVRASNGVVVITTKSGRFDVPTTIDINSSVTLGEKPKLYSTSQLAPEEIIHLEKYLYEQGHYSNSIASETAYLSPVVQILYDLDKGGTSEGAAQHQLQALYGPDIRDDLMKHYYRNQVLQQYVISLSGGGRQNKFYVSAGYDRNLGNLVSDLNDRLSINAKNTYRLMRDKMQIVSGITFALSNTISNSGDILNDLYTRPYSQLADAQGNPLPIFTYRKEWLDNMQSEGLLDWSWKPLEELSRRDNRRKLADYQLDIDVSYRLVEGLDLGVRYRYGHGSTELNGLRVADSYYVRDLVNRFSQLPVAGGQLIRPVPGGDILERGTIQYTSQQFRPQIDYRLDAVNHSLTALIGAEIKDYNYQADHYTMYGYDRDLGAAAAVNHEDYFQTLATGAYGQIPGSPSQSGMVDRYFSLFANAMYVFKQRYSLSGSVRRDESNLFGVKANQRGVPLWSVGAAWIIDKEDFYNVDFLNGLKLRVTNGYNGNLDKTVSAFVTAQSYPGNVNRFGNQFATLLNPPNPSLRWERVNMTNVAIEFAAFENRIIGSMEYYIKKGKDIIGNSPLPPSSGITNFRGNSADISGRGFDVAIHTKNIKRSAFNWDTHFLFSKTTDRIDDYKVQTSVLGFHVGYPYSGLFSYRWAGLSSKNGDPLGYLNGDLSNEWGRIVSTDNIGETTVYSGQGTPMHFGSVRNNFSWNGLSVSVIVAYKAGYYFRSPSVSYTEMYSLRATHVDYRDRWQKPGDEHNGHVPSAVYPSSNARDNFYINSEILVEKGDHLRIQDIRLSYDFHLGGIWQKYGKASLYLYANNLGVVWRSNKRNLDPENLFMSAQRSIAMGLKLGF